MPLPQKRWFRLADVAARWNMPLSDIEDYALDEMLQLSVFVVDVPVETNGSRGGEDRSIQGMPLLNGPQPLQRTSLLEIFREGQAEVRAFRSERPNKHLYVWSGAPAVIVRREDLILTREERDRFEHEHAVATGEPSAVWHNDDFTRVRVANEWHSFGPKQAAVLRLLKAASDGGNPWLDGKRLLEEADAATMRLIDLFKRKPAWRQLVEADGKGRYRLNSDLLSPERQRVRFYRSGTAITRAVGAEIFSR